MKQFIFLFFFLPLFAYAQNIGIGTTSPANKLHVMGNLLVNEPALSTNTAPSALQTKTLVNASTITFTGSDSTGLIYDPGGPAGNYIGNLTSYAVVYSTANCIGFELDFQQMDLAAGDSLIIKESSTSINPTWYAVGNGYNTTGKISISGTQFYLIFKSNNDGINGSGFALLYKTLYRNTQQPVNVSSFSGNSLFYDAKNSAFRVGLNSSAARGDYSFGSGYLVTASGPYSNAIGFNTSASGYASTATGYGSLASAQYSNAMGLQSSATGSVSTAIGDGSSATGSVSTAIGYRALATGNFSTAIGNTTNASGHYSTAIGYQNTASGAYSTAIGYGTLANNSGAAAMGNATTASGINSTAMGTISVASGSYSTAMGYNTSASGAYSTAMGYNTTASGNFSTAIGYHVSTLGYLGSLIIGDASSTTNLNIVSDNSFRARFVNGYGFFTGTNIGVYVQPGGNSWVAFSDVRFKENFIPVDGEKFLKSIANMPQYTWNYKTQDPKTFRHYGPMAQDFYKAFGRDKLGEIGCDTTINQQDFLGVSFIAIQALEKRTKILQQENDALKEKNELLEKRLKDNKDQLGKRLLKLELRLKEK